MRQKKFIFFLLLSIIGIVGIVIGIFFSYKNIKNEELECMKLYEKAQKLLKEKQLEAAIYCLKILIRNYEKCRLTPLSYYQLAKIHEFTLADFDKAKQYYTFAASYKNTPFEKEVIHKLKIYDSKITFYKDVIKNYPEVKYLNFLFLLKSYKANLNDAKRDIYYLIEGLKEKNKKWHGIKKLYLLLAKIDKYQNELHKAEQEFKKLNNYLELADIYYKINEYKKALLYLDKIKNPNNIVFYGKGEIYYRMGDYETAIKCYNRVLGKKFTFFLPLYKDNKKSYLISDYFSGHPPEVKLAHCHLLLSDSNTAINILTEYINNIDTTDKYLHNWQKNIALLTLGLCYEKKNNLALAIKTYKSINEELLDVDMTKFASYIRIANIYAISGEYNKAIRWYNKLLKENNKFYIEALYRIGRCKEAIGDKVAPTYYEKILNNDSEHDNSIELAYYHYIRKKQASTLNLFQTQLDKIEEDAAKRYGDRIMNNIKKIIKIYPEKKEYQLILADISYYQARFKEAKNYLKNISMNDEVKNIITTYSNKPNSIKEFNKMIIIKQRINGLVKKEDKKAQDYLQLAKLYREIKYIDLVNETYKKLIQLNDNTIRADYFKNFNDIINKIESIKQEIYNQLTDIQQLDFSSGSKFTELDLLKEKITQYKKELLIIRANILFGIKGEILNKDRLTNELKIIIDNKTFALILQNYIPLIPINDEFREKQNNLLDNLTTLYQRLIQVEEAIDIYNTSGMQPDIIFEMQLNFLEEFKVLD